MASREDREKITADNNIDARTGGIVVDAYKAEPTR
jgi:hypothetical protein